MASSGSRSTDSRRTPPRYPRQARAMPDGRGSTGNPRVVWPRRSKAVGHRSPHRSRQRGRWCRAPKLCFAEAKQRVDALYYPYHRALRGLVEDTEEVFGGCLLIDCHSMPSAACLSGGTEAADFVLGDCHGTSCTPAIVEAGREFLTERHLTVALNAPYSGGFTTGHYGCPERHPHALQIEINRALYMKERSYRRKPGFSRLAVELAELIDRLSQIMQDCLPRR